MLDEKDLQAIAEFINRSVQESENRTKAYMESHLEKNINLLAEGHAQILERLPEAEEQAQLKSRVRVLERVVIDLRNEIETLKKAN